MRKISDTLISAALDMTKIALQATRQAVKEKKPELLRPELLAATKHIADDVMARYTLSPENLGKVEEMKRILKEIHDISCVSCSKAWEGIEGLEDMLVEDSDEDRPHHRSPSEMN